VVDCAERALGIQPLAIEQAAHAVELRGLDGFIESHLRHDGRNAFREHRPAATGWNKQEQAIPSGDPDLDLHQPWTAAEQKRVSMCAKIEYCIKSK
jgi:hypothetical protein